MEKIRTTLREIDETVCQVFGIDTIHTKSRKRIITDAKKVYGVLAVRYTYHTLTQIGQYINADHSTITYYRRSSKDLATFDRNFQQRLTDVDSRIKQNLEIAA